MESITYIEIPLERYTELILAEQEAKKLKRHLHTANETFSTIEHKEIGTLCGLFPIDSEVKQNG
jgi:hypothetical protein